MRKRVLFPAVLALMLLIALIAGCSQKKPEGPAVRSTVQIQAGPEVLEGISLTLPEGMTRETVSNVQHDFLKDGKQVGGIAIVDITNEQLDAPYDNLFLFFELLAAQLMPEKDPDAVGFINAGGNPCAYIQLDAGDVNGTETAYVHNLFRGNTYNYDVWFDAEALDRGTMETILGSLSAEDIPAELNKSPF